MKQYEFPFPKTNSKPKTKRTKCFLFGNVRIGRIDPRFIITGREVGDIFAPHGKAAQNPFDRDVDMMDSFDEEEN